MKAKKIRALGLSFFVVLSAMIVFNSCDKYSNTYAVDTSKCSLCLTCVSVCGQHAISVVGSGTSEYVHIDEDRCIGCGKCYNSCTYKAIYSD
jgi:2-oxoglutarate ferredoxin oxidoreductase subunit delta